jgi:hypothetical protein
MDVPWEKEASIMASLPTASCRWVKYRGRQLAGEPFVGGAGDIQ